jgi:hypothetical protein
MRLDTFRTMFMRRTLHSTIALDANGSSGREVTQDAWFNGYSDNWDGISLKIVLGPEC